MDTWDELPACFSHAAACIKIRECQLRRTTCNLCTRVTNYIKVNGGIFKHLLWAVTNLSFKRKIQIKLQLTVCKFSFYITIYIAFLFVDSNSSIMVTILWNLSHCGISYQYWHVYCCQPQWSFIGFINICYIFWLRRLSLGIKTHDLKKIYICMCVCVCVCVYIYIYIYIYIDMCVCTHTHSLIHSYICLGNPQIRHVFI